jgi:hypothetical protein
MLYATDFVKSKNYPGEKYAVCKIQPLNYDYPGVVYLYPDDNNFKRFKEGAITKEQFAERYNVVLNKSRNRLMNLKRMVEEQERDIVLVCHCPEGEFCHRDLIINFMVEQLGFNPDFVKTLSKE